VGKTLFHLTCGKLMKGDEVCYESDLDWHGLHNAGDCLLAVDPVHDHIHEFTLDGEHVGHYAWKPDSAGRLHNNDIWVDGDDIYQCTHAWGVCRNGVPLDMGKHTQPHSVMRHEGKTYFCASRDGTVVCDGAVLCSPGGFTRGIFPLEWGFWVGSSQQRHEAGGKGSLVTAYSWSGRLITTVELEVQEVYAITIPGTGT
jgi:hypothetical protein